VEAEWEAYFETNSYGFRPGYSTADAKWVIARQLQGGPKYFLDADIKSCFDNVNQQYLLKKLNTIKMFGRQIQAWLEAGIFTDYSKGSFEINESETSQGSVLSPLLVNIALHGLQKSIDGQFGKRNEIKVVQYAHAFVIFGKTLKSLQKVKKITVQFLKSIELKFSEEKLRLGHSMKKLIGTEKSPGLDFLDCHFRNVNCIIHSRVITTLSAVMCFNIIEMFVLFIFFFVLFYYYLNYNTQSRICILFCNL
jgi:RNA-directed DNA polymerase